MQNIQSLVSSIRSEAGYPAVSAEITAIANVVGQVVSATETAISSTGNAALQSQAGAILDKLSSCRERLLAAREKGADIAEAADGPKDKSWRAWNQSLPPIAFEIARDTKELVMKIDADDQGGRADDDFS